MASSCSHPLDNCKNYIEHTIKRKGPLDPFALKEIFSSNPNQCPTILVSTDVNKLIEFVLLNTNLFVIKKGYICLAQLEEKFKSVLRNSIKKCGSIPFCEVQEILTSADKNVSLYIQATDCWQQGTIDFLFRNNDVFELNEETISLKDQRNSAEKANDTEAVLYFKNIVLDKGCIKIVSLVGHLNQAPECIKTAVKSTNPEVFKQFLQRNAEHFSISGDIVSCESNQTLPEAKSDRKALMHFKQRLEIKGGAQKLSQLAGYLSQTPTEITDIIGSKTPTGLSEFLKKYPAEISVKQDLISLLYPPADKSNLIQSTTAPKVLACSTVNVKEDPLLVVLGQEVMDSLEELPHISQVDLTYIETMWFDLGKKPILRIRSEDSTSTWKVFPLGLPEMLHKNFLDAVLQHPRVIKVSQTLYGISDSMHTLRAMWLGESLCGLTIFPLCETPFPGDHEDIKESTFNGIKLVSYRKDRVSRSMLSYFVRMVCKASSADKHVILLDYHAQICGADLSHDVGCGNTRRLVCWDDPREALKEAAAHSPDMIVTNCCQEEGTIYALEKVQRSGIETVAVITSSLNEQLTGCHQLNSF